MVMSDHSSILALMAKYEPPPKPRLPPADDIRVAAAKQVLHKRNGRGWRVPAYAVKSMRVIYDKVGSLEATGRIFGVHKSDVGRLLRRNGMSVGPTEAHPTITHNGVKYRFNGSRYYVMCGRGNQNTQLHRVIWEERHGPIPAGHKLAFLTSNYHDMSDANFRLMTKAEHHAFVINCRWRPRKAA